MAELTVEQRRALALAAARRRQREAPQARTWGQYLRENIVGEGAPDTPGEKLGALLNMGGEAMTFGLVGDEAASAADAAIGRGGYDERLDFYRGQQAAVEESNPALSFGAKVAPALLPGLGVARGIAAIPSLLGRAVASGGIGGATGTVYGFMEGEGGRENRVAEGRDTGLLSGALSAAIPVAGAAVGRVARGISERVAAGRMAAAAPSVDDLTAQAGALYDQARRSGVTASQQQTQGLAGTIRGIATREGLITPAGRIAESYPKLRDVLSMVDDFAKGTMNPTQMQAVRRTLQGAAGSTDGNERRVGRAMLEAFDNFVEPLAPEFRQANALYRRAMQGDMIDTAIELAGIRAGQFTGSGFENALRTEFRALARQIAKGQLRGLSPDQVAAIKRVAEGGSIENILRDLGKAAPRGIVSTGISAGVPFMVGNAVGGPAMGIGAGILSLGAGEVGRRAATAMQTRNAQIASGLMRSGGTLPSLPQAGQMPAGLATSLLFGAVPQASYTPGPQ